MFSSKSKATLILILTLILGILIGGMGSNYIRAKRIGRMAGMRKPEGFREVLVRVIKATPEQREAIFAITDKHHEQFAKQLEEHMAMVEANFDSMKAELKPILTEEQLKIFDEQFKRPKAGPGRPGVPGGQFGGPPPGGHLERPGKDRGQRPSHKPGGPPPAGQPKQPGS